MPPRDAQVQESCCQVVEVHDWPERAVGGPTICVWFGASATEAAAVCGRLEAERKRHGHPFRYEVRDVV